MNLNMKEFKEELKSGNIRPLYVFYGEEGYLREYYLSELKKQVVGDMMPEFNLTVINHAPEFNELSDVVESYPAMNDRRLVIVRDFDVLSANADFSEKTEKLFADMPEHCVLVFVYGNIEYKPDKRRKLYKVMEKHGAAVNFAKASRTDLISWIKRRFLASDKDISNETADFLLFYCGEIMQQLIPEIEKISSYARKREITRADIETVATRNVSSAVFDAANAVAEKKYAKALSVLEELEARNEKPIPVLALIAQQFRRLYATKLIMERGGGKNEVMELLDMKSDYPARLAITAARSVKKENICRAIELSARADAQLKFGGGWEVLSQLIASISAEEKR
ncbi:MAG: DNA polymerase III subunit delta [Oscillospiraceae bacterium]|nr:DNA polymerase III subunit delta [Oscillospiraceae bacterium]